MGSDHRAGNLRPRNLYFNPRSPHGERLRGSELTGNHARFQSTLPAWGATSKTTEHHEHEQFQSTLPAWGATASDERTSCRYKFQSTLPAWGATVEKEKAFIVTAISIHAPRMGSDHHDIEGVNGGANFNPRSPHGERQAILPTLALRTRFQSTLPAWGATAKLMTGRYGIPISIHAPRMGSDSGPSWQLPHSSRFQSTLPAWGATYSKKTLDQMIHISIHAPRMGSDRVTLRSSISK